MKRIVFLIQQNKLNNSFESRKNISDYILDVIFQCLQNISGDEIFDEKFSKLKIV